MASLMETLRESSSSMRGLTDYTQDKARVRRHDRFVKKVRLVPRAEPESDEEITTRRPMTLQEFRERLSQDDNGEEEEVTFMLRVDRKRRRDGSTHSIARADFNISHDSEGKYKVEEKPRGNHNPRYIAGKAKILVRTPSQEKLKVGASTDETSTPRKGRRPNIPDLSESEQSQTSIFEASVKSENSIAQAKQSAFQDREKIKSSVGSVKTENYQQGNPNMPLHLQTSAHSKTAHEDDGDDGERPLPGQPRINTLYDPFTRTFGRPLPIRNPSDSDESFSSFAQKYSRFAQSDNEPKPQASPQSSDSAMDFNESFSSFASFATEDEDWAAGGDGNSFFSFLEQQNDLRGLLDGGQEEDEEDDELSIGDQSPDSVIVDLTSVSTSVNSQSPRSASKASVSRERKSIFEVPLNDSKESRNRKEERRSRREAGDECSVGSKHSTRSGGSWLSRHSTRSSGSRFTRLESYLKKNSREREERKSSSKNSKEKQDDPSAVSGLSEEIMKLADLADEPAEEFTKNPFSGYAQNDERPSKIKSNPFLLADRNQKVQNKNNPTRNFVSSPVKLGKVWKVSESPRMDSQVLTPLKTVGKVFKISETPRTDSQVMTPLKSVGKAWKASESPQTDSPVKKVLKSPGKTWKASEPPHADDSPTKMSLKPPPLALPSSSSGVTVSPKESPAPSPGKLNQGRLSIFAKGNGDIPEVVRTGIKASNSARLSTDRPQVHASPRRAKSSEGRLSELGELSCPPPLSSPAKPTRESLRSISGNTVIRNGNGVGDYETCSVPEKSAYTPDESALEESSKVQTPSNMAEFSKNFQNSSHLLKRKDSLVPTKAASAPENASQSSPGITGSPKKPYLSQSAKKGINLFNPSATSTGPKERAFPRFVGDRVSPMVGSSTSHAGSNRMHPTILSADSMEKDKTHTTSIKVTKGEERPTKSPTKVKSYLKKFEERNRNETNNDLVQVSSARNKWKPEKLQSNRTIQSEPTNDGRKSCEHREDAAPTKHGCSAPTQAQTKNGATKSFSMRKPSSTSIDNFLESHKNDRESSDVFEEPVPSPWRPTSNQEPRSRLRGTDTASRGSKMSAASRNSNAPRAAASSHLSMFQPHRQVSVSSMPTQNSPMRSPTRGRASLVMPEGETEGQQKLSLVEQRRQMFGGSKGTTATVSTQSCQQPSSPSQKSRPSNVKQLSILSLPQLSPTKRGDAIDPNEVGLPSANDITRRINKWKSKQDVTPPTKPSYKHVPTVLTGV